MSNRDRNEEGGPAGPASPQPELAALARDWITLWQSEIAALAHDREAAETISRMAALWAGMAGAWMRAAPPSPAGAPPNPEWTPPAHDARPAAAAGAAAAAAAPDAGLDALGRVLGELAERLGGIERRLDAIDGGAVRRGTGDKDRRGAGRGGRGRKKPGG